jgi:hypothetical protein
MEKGCTACGAQPAKSEQLLAAFARMKEVLARCKKNRSYSTEYKR